MKRNNSEPSVWFFLPPVITSPRTLRRSNRIAIAILVFFTIGLVLIGFLPERPNNALATGHPQARIGSSPRAHHIR